MRASARNPTRRRIDNTATPASQMMMAHVTGVNQRYQGVVTAWMAEPRSDVPDVEADGAALSPFRFSSTWTVTNPEPPNEASGVDARWSGRTRWGTVTGTTGATAARMGMAMTPASVPVHNT